MALGWIGSTTAFGAVVRSRGCAVRSIAKECFRGLGDYKMRIIGIVTFAAAALSCASGSAQNSPAHMQSNDYRTLT
jgi:hypothetical protein